MYVRQAAYYLGHCFPSKASGEKDTRSVRFESAEGVWRDVHVSELPKRCNWTGDDERRLCLRYLLADHLEREPEPDEIEMFMEHPRCLRIEVRELDARLAKGTQLTLL